MARDERTKADYQPWNHEHFMADRYVRRMRPNIRKSYVMLLHESFFCSTRPYLPDDDDELWLLADCESKEEWMEQSLDVREMFESFESEGVKLLVQRRVEEDWDRILNKRGVVSEARSKAAKARWEREKQADANECKTMQTMLSKEKLSISEAEKSEAELSEEIQIPETGQENTLKAKKEIPFISRKILGVRAEIWDSTWAEIKELERIYGSTEVCSAFEDWAKTKVGEIKDKPVSEFLKIADGLLMGTFTLSADPTLTSLIDDLVYATRGEVTFNDGQKFSIGRLLETYTSEEILRSGKEFYATVKDDAFKMKNAAGNFVQQAEQLIKFARREKAEKEQEASAVDSAKEKMQREAEEDRIARQKARDAEDSLVEEELGD